MNNLPIILPALPEIFLSLCIVVFMMIGVFMDKQKAYFVIHRLTIIILIILFALIWLSMGDFQIAFNAQFISDDFSVFIKLLLVLSVLFSLMMGTRYVRLEKMNQFEYPILMLFALLGMFMMVSANSLLSVYIGLELQSLSLYILAAFDKRVLRSAEAGLKYFILGSLASGFLLYGISLVYGFTGTIQFWNLTVMLENAAPSLGVYMGLVFILSGIAFKLSAVPFHMWTPDVYEGSPTPITAFFSIAPKIAAFALLVRLLIVPFHALSDMWQPIIVTLSVLSMFVGAFAAIAQKNIKRMMAYSSIGHVGYALMGLAAMSVQGINSLILYLVIYVFMSIGVFSIILMMKSRSRMLENISDLSGLHKDHPVLALLLLVLMFSMAGIPPFAGFFAKLFIFQAAVGAHLYALTIFAAVMSVVSAFYYLRIVKIIYFDDVLEPLDAVNGVSLRLVLGVACFITITLIFYFQPLSHWTYQAANSLFFG